MKDLYRRMFDEVRASERLRREVINMTNTERTGKRHRHLPGAAVIAAVLLIAMTGTALAVSIAFPGSLTGWFEQQWRELGGDTMPEAQLELIDSLTQPVGVSDTQNGVTVTLDSITVGDSALWLLLKADGVPVPGEDPGAHHFGPQDLVFAVNPDKNEAVGGYGFDSIHSGVDENGTLTVLLRYTATLTGGDTLLGGGEATLLLQDLLYSDSTLVEGNWTLPFSIRPVDEQTCLTVDSAEVPALDHENGGAEVLTTLHDIRVSPTGIRFSQASGDQMYYPRPMAVILSNGTEVRMDGGGSRWMETESGGVWSSDYYWRLPVELSQAEALRFEDVRIPLK